MKRYFEWLIIVLAVVLSSGAVYGQDKPTEVIVRGVIPTEWGTLRSVMRGDGGYETRLFFEDGKGIVRMVILTHEQGYKWNVVGEDTVVIERSKRLERMPSL